LWFFKNERNRSWEENQRPIITFSTVEDFWALYNHIEQASKLIAGCDYSLFKVIENIGLECTRKQLKSTHSLI
jgi:translation initiation factor 4E